MKTFIALLMLFTVICFNISAQEAKPATGNKSTSGLTTEAIPKLIKTDSAWKRELSPELYEVAREKGTERPFTGKYWDHHQKGIYHCACCELPLFSSTAKFESGTGWPSFFIPVKKINVTMNSDHSLGMERTEVTCAKCGAHLGHVFNDGPAPTHLRYCINSVCLEFKEK